MTQGKGKHTIQEWWSPRYTDAYKGPRGKDKDKDKGNHKGFKGNAKEAGNASRGGSV